MLLIDLVVYNSVVARSRGVVFFVLHRLAFALAFFKKNANNRY